MKQYTSYRILQRLIDGTLPRKYRPVVIKWLISNQDEEEKNVVLQKIWIESSTDTNDSIKQSLTETRKKIKLLEKTKRQPSLHIQLLRYTAIFLLPIITGITVWNIAEKQPPEIEMIECYVPNGEQQELKLSDGSCIQVNAGTVLIYPKTFTGKQRTVYLAGEANFSVAKDDTKPFIVQTGPLKIQVLGTTFNIQAYPGNKNIVTTLEKGSIKVFKENDPHQIIVMQPNQQLTYQYSDNTFTTSWVEASDFSAWGKGELKFNNQSFIEILEVLERRYNIRFRVEQDIHHSDVYNMNFKSHESIDDILQVFTKLLGDIYYRKEGNLIYLYPKGKEVKE